MDRRGEEGELARSRVSGVALFPRIDPPGSGVVRLRSQSIGRWRVLRDRTLIDGLEEVVSFVVNEDECGKVFDFDLPDGFHA